MIPSLPTASTPSASTSTPSAVEMNCVNERRHHVKMTLFGAVCLHPPWLHDKTLQKLWSVSSNTLRTHFDTAQCYTGDLPDCTNLARDICQGLFTLQELVQKGGTTVNVLVDRVLPVNCTTRSTGSHCLNCGLVGKPSASNLQHYTNQNKKCSPEHLPDWNHCQEHPQQFCHREACLLSWNSRAC